VQKWYELWFQKTLLSSEHAAAYLLSVKILCANTVNNRVPAYQWRHSYVFLLRKKILFILWKSSLYEIFTRLVRTWFRI